MSVAEAARPAQRTKILATQPAPGKIRHGYGSQTCWHVQLGVCLCFVCFVLVVSFFVFECFWGYIPFVELSGFRWKIHQHVSIIVKVWRPNII